MSGRALLCLFFAIFVSSLSMLSPSLGTPAPVTARFFYEGEIDIAWCTIVVTVKEYSSGEPITGAAVTVTNEDVNYTENLTTGSDGVCTFSHLPLGSYTILAEKEGYGTEETSVSP